MIALLRLDDLMEAALAEARSLGTAAGSNAGDHVTDGTTTPETYRHLLDGVEDGDPAVLDDLPSCDLSGQWADSLTATDVASNALDDAGHSREHIESTWGEDTWLTVRDELADAYTFAYDTAVQDSIMQSCRYQLEESNA